VTYGTVIKTKAGRVELKVPCRGVSDREPDL